MSEQQNGIAPILFVGIGAMGEPMAGRLVAAGYRVVVTDVDEARAAEAAERIGATAATSAQAAGTLSGFGTVVLSLPSSPIVESVLLGDGGILARLDRGAVVIDMSSSVPGSTRRIAAAAEARGVAFVDAPVSGGVPKARTGELTIMVGGEADAVESRHALLSAMGATITHVGPSGAGHAMKALNNLLSAIGLVGAAEVLTVAARFGIEPRTALDVLNASTGRNQATEVKYARYVLSRAFDSGFAMQLMVKDLRIALDIAHDAGVPVPISASALEEWVAAIGDLGSAADHTEIAEYVERRAGVQLIGSVDLADAES